jgi:hypothetical protein
MIAWRDIAASVGFAVVLAWVGTEARAQAQGDGETEMPLSKVPMVIVQSARTAAPGVRFEKALKTVDAGVVTFDLIGEDSRGREVDVETTAAGRVLGVGLEIPMSQAPKPVLAALRAKARGMKFSDAEVVTLNGRLIAYRFSGETADGDDVEATVSPDGKSVELDLDD